MGDVLWFTGKGEVVVEEKMIRIGGVIGSIRWIGMGGYRPGRWGFGYMYDE